MSTKSDKEQAEAAAQVMEALRNFIVAVDFSITKMTQAMAEFRQASDAYEKAHEIEVQESCNY